MRLFIAICFNEEVKDSLCDCIQRLKGNVLKGSFVRRENLHLTLHFLGEVSPSKISLIQLAMENVRQDPFLLVMKDIGMFKGTDGDICWVGIEENKAISKIYNILHGELTLRDFALEKRPYKPHLTLGRRVIFKEEFDRETFSKSIPQMCMTVKSISLIKSERIDGRLTYTDIYTKNL